MMPLLAFSEYLQDMATSGMDSDELTLRAIPYFFNVKLNILPTVVRDGRLLLAPINSIARARFTLDHFAEDQVIQVSTGTKSRLFLIQSDR